MVQAPVDFKKEQKATLSRSRRKYGIMAKMLFMGMDLFYGKERTLGKMRLLEMLARIPYQAWETHQYQKVTHHFENDNTVKQSEDIIEWAREAQDNEFWHLRVVVEKIKEDRVKLNFLKDHIAPHFAALFHHTFSRTLAFLNTKAAFKLNADFEDHAEHEYMKFVEEHPELEEQAVSQDIAKVIGNFKNWADVFRKIALDERQHMNNSLIRCGRSSEVVPLPASKEA